MEPFRSQTGSIRSNENNRLKSVIHSSDSKKPRENAVHKSLLLKCCQNENNKQFKKIAIHNYKKRKKNKKISNKKCSGNNSNFIHHC